MHKMWPFKPPVQQATAPKPVSPSLADVLDRMQAWERRFEERVVKIEQRQELQEKGLKLLEMDWHEWFDKFRTLYVRLAKRVKQAVAQATQEEQEGPPEPAGATRDQIPGYGHPPLPIGGPRPTRRNY